MFHEDLSLGVVDLTLRYDGYIPSGQGGHHSDLKQAIRRHFSAQIGKYWRGSGALKHYPPDSLPLVNYERGQPCVVTGHVEQTPMFKTSVCGFSVIPLVSYHNRLVCDLQIVLLGDEKALLGAGGDLDNKLKIVFDALRMPQHDGEVPAPMFGQNNENLFCLFEDDSLITRFSAETRLSGGSPADYELTVQARVWAGDLSHPCLVRV